MTPPKKVRCFSKNVPCFSRKVRCFSKNEVSFQRKQLVFGQMKSASLYIMERQNMERTRQHNNVLVLHAMIVNHLLSRARTRVWTRVISILLSHLSQHPHKPLYFKRLQTEKQCLTISTPPTRHLFYAHLAENSAVTSSYARFSPLFTPVLTAFGDRCDSKKH